MGLWPNSGAGNCHLLPRIPPQIQPPSFPALHCRAAWLCAVKQLPCAPQRGLHASESRPGGHWVKLQLASPLPVAQFGHRHLATLFVPWPKCGRPPPSPPRSRGKPCFPPTLQRVNGASAGFFFLLTNRDPCEFYGEGWWGRRDGAGEENLLYGFDRNSHHGIIMEVRSLRVMKTICRVKTHTHKY